MCVKEKSETFLEIRHDVNVKGGKHDFSVSLYCIVARKYNLKFVWKLEQGSNAFSLMSFCHLYGSPDNCSSLSPLPFGTNFLKSSHPAFSLFGFFP